MEAPTCRSSGRDMVCSQEAGKVCHCLRPRRRKATLKYLHQGTRISGCGSDFEQLCRCAGGKHREDGFRVSSVAPECRRTVCSIVGVGWRVWRSQPPAHFSGSQEKEEATIGDGGLAIAFEGLPWTGQPAVWPHFPRLQEAPRREGTKGDRQW